MMVGSPRTSTVMQHGWTVKFEDRVWLDHQETGTVMQHGWSVNLKTGCQRSLLSKICLF